MGVTAFFYAASGQAAAVEQALREVYPDEVGPLMGRERAEGSVVDAIYDNDDGVELVLWQDRELTGFAESELCLFEEEPLRRLSERTGTVIGVCIGDHGGSYILDVYRDGELVRSLNNEAEPRGNPIPEESGVDLSSFDDEQILRIWKAFGLSDFFEGIPPLKVFASP